MAKFLFWNIRRKDLTDQIVKLCRDCDVDVLILAEMEIENKKLEESLNSGQERKYFSLSPQFDNIAFFHRYSECDFKPLYYKPEMSGMSVPNIRLTLPNGKDILLIAVHLKSKLFRNNETQCYYASRIMNEIRYYEEKLTHTRTIVVGDMNMNPFEAGLTSFAGFHSVMDKRTAMENERMMEGIKNQYFYNPMWRLMGNTIQGTPGTYYYRSSQAVEFFWHTFDQVLIRPSLIEYFKEGSLKTIDFVGSISLLNSNGRPDKKNYSDHLPLFFEIDIENI